MPIEGGCHCGAIRYALSAKPTASMICHCRTCRAVSGGVAIAWISIAPDRFEFIRGKPKHYVSSDNVLRQFCSRCGAQLTYARTDEPDNIDITTTTLDDPEAFPPAHHSWASHDLAWLKFADGLPTFPQGRYD
jgi:hypothetical protein